MDRRRAHGDRPTVLITGATGGIGRALARHYQERGARLVLTGRQPPTLLPPDLFTPTSYCRADLGSRDCGEALAAFLDHCGIEDLDLVIHNAATGYYGPAAGESAEGIRQTVAVNLLAPIALTRILLPRLARMGGKVVFVGSVASALPGPEYAVYAATKAALDGFAWSLGIELAGSVAVQVVQPGGTRTGFHARVGVPPEVAGRWRLASPEEVAAQIARAIAGRRRAVVLGVGNRLARAAGRYAPGLVDRAMRKTGSAPPAALGERPRCAITGAADGIGKALAGRFAAAGWSILGIDRDPRAAERTAAELRAAGAEVEFLLADLGRADEVARVGRRLAAEPLSALVHNAGINRVGRFAASDLAAQAEVVEVNLLAPMLLTAEVLRGGGLGAGAALVFISSLCHFTGYPGSAVYAASKDGLASYARSLGVALAPSGIHVLTVFPGPTRTEHARRASPDNRREHRRMPPEELADRIVRALAARKRTLVPGLGNQAAAVLGRCWPRIMAMVMRKTILEKLA